MKILLLLIAASLLPAEPIHSLKPKMGRFKISDDLLIQWNGNARVSPTPGALGICKVSGSRISIADRD